MLRDCGALKVLMPEVDALLDKQQSHTLQALEQAAGEQLPLHVRWACLLHELTD